MANVKKSMLILVKQISKGKHAKAIYLCDCGSQKEIFVGNVKRLHTISCGCQRKKVTNFKHGLIHHPLYYIHSGIVQRCTNPKNPMFMDYGGRGVTICEEWKNDFKSFFDWCIKNGWQPNMELDKDIKGGMTYSPENCVIVNHKQNSNNRRSNKFIEYHGETKTVMQWSDELNIDAATLYARLNRLGWTIERALSTPRKY